MPLMKHPEPAVHHKVLAMTEAGETGPGSPAGGLALGVERIGLLALKAPLIAAIAVALLAVAAAFGTTRLKVDDSLSQLFRSNDPAI
jgi:uncharacterized protein